MDIRSIPTQEILAYRQRKTNSNEIKVVLLSNISIHLLLDTIQLSLAGIDESADIFMGDYDNIVQGSYDIEQDNCVVVFWEAINMSEDLRYKIDFLVDAEYDEFLQKIKSEISLVVANLSNARLVLFNKFSSSYIGHTAVGKNKFSLFVDSLNEHLVSIVGSNFQIIDIEKIFQAISIQKSIDLRFYNTAKTLYTIEFLKHYAWHVLPHLRVLFGKTKKVLILDCDNTLWKGIVGEDGVDAIEPYMELQYIVKSLVKSGVIVCLCSKNNEKDVFDVFEKRIDMPLRMEDIVMYKINWQDKASNIEEIVKTLNVGLESVVFVDDSHFEVGLINEKLPTVETLIISNKKHEIVIQMLELKALFFNHLLTDEDAKKTQMYHADAARNKDKSVFQNINDYLRSLNICIEAKTNEVDDIVRIAQLTQKTNQFNLTTKRYSESEVASFVNDDKFLVFSCKVFDRYGDSGVTVVVIMHLNDGNTVKIDTFLMSCRVMGRNIEFAIFDYIVNILQEMNIKILHARYIKTQKNEQVSDFYDKLGFDILSQDESIKNYILDLSLYKRMDIDYVKIIKA